MPSKTPDTRRFEKYRSVTTRAALIACMMRTYRDSATVARLLDVSTSLVTCTVRRVEHLYGARLFVRTPNGGLWTVMPGHGHLWSKLENIHRHPKVLTHSVDDLTRLAFDYAIEYARSRDREIVGEFTTYRRQRWGST